MCTLIINGPETPDPTQLDLFGTGTSDIETVNNSTDSIEGSQPIKPLIRSPTDSAVPCQFMFGRTVELNEAQQKMVSSLHDKSRELVRISRVKKQQELSETTEENDLAR